jgi:hypothetical protein
VKFFLQVHEAQLGGKICLQLCAFYFCLLGGPRTKERANLICYISCLVQLYVIEFKSIVYFDEEEKMLLRRQIMSKLVNFAKKEISFHPFFIQLLA